MQTPYITIDIGKLEHNTKTIISLCKSHNIHVAGVTKGTLGMPEVAQSMLRGGVEWIGESRLNNIERLKQGNVNAPILLVRSPHKSELDRVIDIVDISLNSEYEIINSISEKSLKKGKSHNIIIMVDLGDLREGVLPDDLLPLVRDVVKMKGIRILGIGMNLTDLNGTMPTYENNLHLVELAEEVEDKCRIKLEYLSAGNSSSLKLLTEGKLPERINHFRIGEGILLGRETIYREKLPGTFQDAFILSAEIIEKKLKPSIPIGDIGQDAFGNIPILKDKGMMVRGILNVGRQDINSSGLSSREASFEIIGATSDHMLVDLTKAPDCKIGDVISFDVNYSALLAAMTSPFVKKIVTGSN